MSFKIGDTVQICTPGAKYHLDIGTILETSKIGYSWSVQTPLHGVVDFHEYELVKITGEKEEVKELDINKIINMEFEKLTYNIRRKGY